jgi:hypothetical protein
MNRPLIGRIIPAFEDYLAPWVALPQLPVAPSVCSSRLRCRGFRIGVLMSENSSETGTKGDGSVVMTRIFEKAEGRREDPAVVQRRD